MYRAVRTIHLLTALFTLPFLLTYWVSSVVLAHRSWVRITPTISQSTMTLDPGIADGRELARRLMRQGAVRGELMRVEPHRGGIHLNVVRPGAFYEIYYSPDTGATRIVTGTASILASTVALHVLRGLWHTEAAQNAWVAALGLLSLGLLAMGVTGLVLWFQNRSERWIGGGLVAVGMVVALTLIVSMRAG